MRLIERLLYIMIKEEKYDNDIELDNALERGITTIYSFKGKQAWIYVVAYHWYGNMSIQQILYKGNVYGKEK